MVQNAIQAATEQLTTQMLRPDVNEQGAMEARRQLLVLARVSNNLTRELEGEQSAD